MLGETLVGYRVDRDVGPLVMVATGGVLTELARDRSLRLAPVELETARAMLTEVRGLMALPATAASQRAISTHSRKRSLRYRSLRTIPRSRKPRSTR